MGQITEFSLSSFVAFKKCGYGESKFAKSFSTQSEKDNVNLSAAGQSEMKVNKQSVI